MGRGRVGVGVCVKGCGWNGVCACEGCAFACNIGLCLCRQADQYQLVPLQASWGLVVVVVCEVVGLLWWVSPTSIAALSSQATAFASIAQSRCNPAMAWGSREIRTLPTPTPHPLPPSPHHHEPTPSHPTLPYAHHPNHHHQHHYNPTNHPASVRVRARVGVRMRAIPRASIALCRHSLPVE